MSLKHDLIGDISLLLHCDKLAAFNKPKTANDGMTALAVKPERQRGCRGGIKINGKRNYGGVS